MPETAIAPGASPVGESGSAPLLVLNDVHTYLGGSHVLQGVGFEVLEGKTTVLLGRNGAGKSTTLRTIMGITRAERGSICLAGKEIGGYPSHSIARLGVGFVPEDREVFTSLTVEENLSLAARSGASAKVVNEVYALFPDLRLARYRSAGALSGGQQQMLAIGRSLMNANRIVLVDEPTKGLAPIIVAHLQEIFAGLRQEGETILLVEQNLAFAQAVGDHYFVLDEGRVVHGGDISELAIRPEILRQYIGV
jgi:branched-chain amino acid transport system ATP-binding protein